MSVADICEKAGLKKRWFYRFRAGDFDDPGTSKIQRLHEVLSSDVKKTRSSQRSQEARA